MRFERVKVVLSRPRVMGPVFTNAGTMARGPGSGLGSHVAADIPRRVIGPCGGTAPPFSWFTEDLTRDKEHTPGHMTDRRRFFMRLSGGLFGLATGRFISAALPVSVTPVQRVVGGSMVGLVSGALSRVMSRQGFPWLAGLFGGLAIAGGVEALVYTPSAVEQLAREALESIFGPIIDVGEAIQSHLQDVLGPYMIPPPPVDAFYVPQFGRLTTGDHLRIFGL